MLQRQIALIRSQNKEEARSLFRHGHLPERLPQIADSVGLPVEVCRGVLAGIVWKFTEGLRPSKLNAGLIAPHRIPSPVVAGSQQ